MAEDMIKKYNIQLSEDKTKLKVNGKIGKSTKDTEWVKAHKGEIINILLEREEKEAAAREAYKRKLEAIEGLRELQKCMSDWSEYHIQFNRFVERDCTGKQPVKPETTVEEMRKMYPRAAAYIKADQWSCAAHFYKAACGDKAKKAILDGQDYKDAIIDMEDSWKAYTDEHAFD